MLGLGFIKKEKIAMDRFKDVIENTNLDILNDIDNVFENKHEGFENKTLNKFFIQNGFSYDNNSKSFQFSAYNASIGRVIDVYVFKSSILFECGCCAYKSLFEIPRDYTEEKARTKMSDLLNGMASNFMDQLQEYINAHGSIDIGDDK